MAGSALIGNLSVNLSLETAAFQQGANLAQKQAQKLGGRMELVGAKITKAGAGLTLGITAPLAAFGKQSVQAAQDAQEMQSAFDVTFGNMSGSVKKWAENTGNALGRSTQEMQRGALAFQELFGKALDPAKSAEMSKSFAVLTQDLASFKNLSNEVAQQKLFSGLSGEAEPLRAVGVFLSEAKVQAEGLAMGLAKVGEKMTEEEKILARASVIRRELALATGDVMRTQDSAANKAREAQAAYEELSVTLGSKLLPLKVALAEIAIKVLEAFQKLSPEAQSFTLGLVAVAGAIGPLMLVLGPLVNVFGQLWPHLVKLTPLLLTFGKTLLGLAIAGGPITVVLLAVGALYLAFKNWDKIGPIVAAMVNTIKTWLVDKLGGIWEGVKAKIETVKQAFRNLADAVVINSYIPDMVEGIGRSIAELQRIMVDPALSATEKVGAAFQNLAGLISGLFGQKTGSIIGAIGNFVGAIAPLLGGLFGGGGGAGMSAVTTAVMGAGSLTGVMGLARGGSGVLGGRSGVDRNVLSLNGSPIARVSKGEHFRVSPANDAGPRVQVIPSPYFDVVVDGRARNVAAPMAGQAAVGGAIGAQQSLARRQRMSLR